ncbi:MAG: carbamoyl-phosphate synthase large subunit, partial [Planctomycetes bacterium]|nr:carbamoyl-phosphate synthase large subunit [Planctomycetota bacterium]
LTIQMKSVGESMSIGRTFKEALQKSIRSLEISRAGLGSDRKDLLAAGNGGLSREEIDARLTTPTVERLFYVRYALRLGYTIEEISERSRIDPWFIDQMAQICETEDACRDAKTLDGATADLLRRAKRDGFSDPQLATIWQTTPAQVRAARKSMGIVPCYKCVDTCGAEFAAETPYYYSTYETEGELRPSKKSRIMILGGGPNRIGQGIEFDYCCCHAAFALRELGYTTVMVNSNPETVSTDYDTSDELYFEPLTEEDVLNLCDALNPEGVIVQLGGQTPLNLARGLAKAGVPIIGTSPESIDRAEDRAQFNALIERLGLRQPPGGIASDEAGAATVAAGLGYPVLVRPSYVLGGRAMEIVYDHASLGKYVREAMDVMPGQPILIDKFIEDAIEVDVDAISDGETTVIGGILEHIEEAGIHSGDAAMTLPPYSLSDVQLDRIRRDTHRLAKELRVKGLMNIQFAVKGETVYVLEVNPRASRTIPFVSKAIGVPLAKLAAKVMVGRTLKSLGFTKEITPPHFSVKESVFPFSRFPGTDIILGPEMRSTGEVMGIDMDLGTAFAKAELAASHRLPMKGRVFISVKDADKRDVVFIAKRLESLGFEIVATEGTGRVLARSGTKVRFLKKIKEGRPNPLDLIINGEIDLILNTPSGKGPKTDEARIRGAAVARKITVITTISGAEACVNAIEAMKRREPGVCALQDVHAAMRAKAEGKG